MRFRALASLVGLALLIVMGLGFAGGAVADHAQDRMWYANAYSEHLYGPWEQGHNSVSDHCKTQAYLQDGEDARRFHYGGLICVQVPEEASGSTVVSFLFEDEVDRFGLLASTWDPPYAEIEWSEHCIESGKTWSEIEAWPGAYVVLSLEGPVEGGYGATADRLLDGEDHPCDSLGSRTGEVAPVPVVDGYFATAGEVTVTYEDVHDQSPLEQPIVFQCETDPGCEDNTAVGAVDGAVAGVSEVVACLQNDGQTESEDEVVQAVCEQGEDPPSVREDPQCDYDGLSVAVGLTYTLGGEEERTGCYGIQEREDCPGWAWDMVMSDSPGLGTECIWIMRPAW